MQDKQRKSVKCYSFIGVLLIVIIVVAVLVGFGVIVLPNSWEGKSEGKTVASMYNASAVPDGENIKADTITGYYMDIRLEGVTTNCYEMASPNGADRAFKRLLNPNFWSRADVDCTTIITFRDVTVKKKPVFLSDVFRMNVPAYGFLGDNVDFLSGVTTPIHEAYYNLFIKYGFSDNELCSASVQLMLLIGNNGYELAPRGDSKVKGSSYFSVKCKVYKKQVSSDVNDPDSPSFELPGGSGVNQNPSKEEEMSFSELFKSLPKWVQYVVYGFAGLLGLALVTTLLRIIFGKK